MEYLNLLADKGYLSLDEIARNVYAETEAHREFISVLSTIARIESLEEACLEVFGEPLNPTPGYWPLRAEMRDMSIVEQSNRRATARVVDETWKLNKLMLVEYDGRWWISGHTWDNASRVQLIDDVERTPAEAEIAAALGSPFATRVRAREFSDIERARFAYARVVHGYMATHPEMAGQD